MDDLFRHAREQGVMLVPSIFWNNYLWPDLCDEPLGAIVSPASRTNAAMRKYATELVSRYKDDPNVLMWELGNEYFLAADLNAAHHPQAAGAGAAHLGTRPERTQEDSLTTRHAACFLYGHDQPHPDARSQPSGHQRRCRTAVDESLAARELPQDGLEGGQPRDHLAALLDANPAPLDVMSVHYYGNLKGEFPPGDRASPWVGSAPEVWTF